MCEDYHRLDLGYTEAWLSGNTDRVMDYARRIRQHKETCPVCSNPMALVDALWPGAQVAETDG